MGGGWEAQGVGRGGEAPGSGKVRVMGAHLRQVTIEVTNRSQAVRILRDVLGMQVIRHEEMDPGDTQRLLVTLNPQPHTLTPQPSTLNHNSSTRNPKP